MAASKAVKLLDRILDAGYPEGTAKKIASGELPMDFISRMNRAREQGNRTQAFRVGGTGDDQLGRLEFDPDAGFAQRQGGGTWFAEDAPLTHSYMTPESASYRTLLDTTEYGRLDAGGQNWNDIYYGDFEFPDGSTIPIDELPELLRSKGFEVSGAINTTDKIGRAAKALGLKGVEIPQVIDVGPNRFAMTRNARKTEEGKDWLSDYDMFGGTNISVQDPSTIRSYYGAAFDPDNKGLKNILGGSAALAVGLGAGDESEASPATTIPRAVSAVDKAINVRVDKKAGIDYADEILSGNKTFETRNTDSLRPYVGQRIGIARTGAGEAKALGEVDIGEPLVVDEATFRTMQDQHLVPPGTDFDIAPGGTKYLYPVSNPERFDAPKDVGRGIVARKILGGGAGAAFGLSASDDSQAADSQPRITPEFAAKQFDRIVSDNTGREKNAYIPVKPTTMDYVQNAGRAIVDYFGTDPGKDMLGGLGQEIAVEGALGSLGQMIFGPAGAVGGAALLPNVAGDPTMDMLNDQGQPMTEAEFAAYRRQLRGN